jgi:hypothetical protein
MKTPEVKTPPQCAAVKAMLHFYRFSQGKKLQGLVVGRF